MQFGLENFLLTCLSTCSNLRTHYLRGFQIEEKIDLIYKSKTFVACPVAKVIQHLPLLLVKERKKVCGGVANNIMLNAQGKQPPHLKEKHNISFLLPFDFAACQVNLSKCISL